MQQLKSIVKSSHPAAKLITIQGTAAMAKKEVFYNRTAVQAIWSSGQTRYLHKKRS